jgi:ribonuclease HI
LWASIYKDDNISFPNSKMTDKIDTWKLFFDGSCTKDQKASTGIVLKDP